MTKTDRAHDVERLSPTTIDRVTFGVRYEPQYGLMDRIGSIIDAVLREKDTPFGPETFPLSQADANEHVLINLETRGALRITYQDTIIQLPADTRSLTRVREMAEDFDEYVLSPLREIVKLRNIVRHGVVLHLDDSSKSLRNPPLARYISPDFPNARSLSMRFTRRLASEEAIVKKRVEDFRNVIYTVEESDDARVHISTDYQEYFRPSLDASEWLQRPFVRTTERALDYFEGEFQAWFTKMVGVSEVA